jgi:glycine/serine hydroxymethyltransferase
MAEIGRLLAQTLRQRTDPDAVATIRAQVRDLCRPFAPYPD